MSRGDNPAPRLGPIALATVGYYLALSVISHLPGTALAEIPFQLWDKALHAAVYAPLGALLFCLVVRARLPQGRVRVLLAWGLAVVWVAALGCVDELHQSLVPGRIASGTDVLADAVGGALGGGVCVLGLWRRQSRLDGLNP